MTTNSVKLTNYVTWNSFLAIVSIALVAVIAMNSFVWAQHTASSEQFEKRMLEQFENVKDRLNRIDHALDKTCPREKRNGK